MAQPARKWSAGDDCMVPWEGAKGWIVRAYPGSGVGVEAQPHIHCVAQGPRNHLLQVQTQIDCNVEDVASATHHNGRIEQPAQSSSLLHLRQAVHISGPGVYYLGCIASPLLAAALHCSFSAAKLHPSRGALQCA